VTPTWTVTLDGDADDLRALVDLGVGVTQEGERFILRSPVFDCLTEALAVHDRAVEQVAIFGGLTRIVEGDASPRTIAVGAIVRDDRKVKALFLSPGTAELRLRATAALSVGPNDPPISPYPRWAALAVRDPAVQQAVRLFGSQPSAVNLYRVFEVIRKDAGGEEKIVQHGWTTRNQITRFRRTVNSPTVLGSEARHGVEPSTSPPDPMSIHEAQAFITRLLEKWLRSK